MTSGAILTSEDTIPTSPTTAVGSDDATRQSTPPSSPPGFPWENADGSADANRTTSHAPSAFSLLGKKRKALDSVSDNARPAKKVATSSKSETKSLTQMQISLGQEVQKKCKTCGMEYVPSSTEDRKLHDKHHKQNTEGYDLGKDFVGKARPYSVFPGVRKEDKICAIDCFDSHARKRRGQAVLEIVQRELGAVEISREEIWDVSRGNWTLSGEATFRAYLYVRASKAIGFVLVQKIEKMHHVIEPTPSAHQAAGVDKDEQKNASGALATLKARQQEAIKQLQQPIQLSKQFYPAQLGISRIWTSATHRQQKIAITLLDTAFKDYNQRACRDSVAKESSRKDAENCNVSNETQAVLDSLMPVMRKMKSKDAVAFSQPTEAGVRLARKWCGKAFGWGVYLD